MQQGPKLTGGGETGAGEFGFDVALSSDGSTALVGGLLDHGVGAAWVFTRSGGIWTQQGSKLTGGGESRQRPVREQRGAVREREHRLVGGAGDNNHLGAAWVFTRSGTTWFQEGPKLTPSGGVNTSSFGFEIALSEDVSTALVGTPYDNDDTGAAWVFTRSAGVWTHQGPKLTASDETSTATSA